jgi:hypothetical protein
VRSTYVNFRRLVRLNREIERMPAQNAGGLYKTYDRSFLLVLKRAVFPPNYVAIELPC